MTYNPHQPPQTQPVYRYEAPSAPPTTNGLAIASLVTSLVSLQLVGIILGHIALGQIKRTGQAGRGLALAGVIIGYSTIGLYLLIAVIAVPVFLGQQQSAQEASVKSDLANANVAVIAYGAANPGIDDVPSLTDGTLDDYGLTLSEYTADIVASGSYSTGVTLTATSVSGHQYQISEGTGILDLG